MFCYPEHIDGEMSKLFARLKGEEFLRGLDPRRICTPGRACAGGVERDPSLSRGQRASQLTYLTLLAAHAEHPLALERMDPAAMLRGNGAKLPGRRATARGRSSRRLIEDMNQLVSLPLPSPVPALVAAAGDSARTRFLEFFAANIRNPHTRRAYSRAVAEFLAWCARRRRAVARACRSRCMSRRGSRAQTGGLSAPSVKQRLAAIRHLFDWLVVGQIVPVNPAASVRGPQHIVKSGKTPVLEPAEARGAARQHRRDDAGGLARPRPDCAHGLFVRARRRGARHEGRGRVRAEPPPLGAVARERRQGARHAVPSQS